MASDDRATTEEIMAALAAQHWASDVLMATVINLTVHDEKPFLPSQSVVWPQFTAAKAVWDKLQFENPGLKIFGFCEGQFNVKKVPGASPIYAPCGKVATEMVRSEHHKRDYFMCDACAEYNTKHGMMVKLRKVNGH